MYYYGYSRENVLAMSKQARNRRRRAGIVIVAALSSLLAVGGAIAWLVDATGSVVNTFQAAEVKTDITETINGMKKTNVAVKNEGDVPAYVRATVVVNWVKTDANGGTTVIPAKADTDYVITYNASVAENGGAWLFHSETGVYYYSVSVAPGASTGILVSNCEQVANAQAPGDGYVLSVDILSESIQATPIDAAESAWTAVNVDQFGKLHLVSGN